MASYEDEEKFAFGDKEDEAFEKFSKDEEKEEKKEDEKEDKKEDKCCNVKTNKKKEKECKKKCKKKGKVFKFVTGFVVATAVLGGSIFGIAKFHEKQVNKGYTDNINTWIDARQGSLDRMVDYGSSTDELFKGNYADLYELYSKLYTVAKYSNKFNQLDLNHDIVDKDVSADLCIDCYADDFEQQCEDIMHAYWGLKNTRAAQTAGTDEYKEFQKICNKMQNTRDNAYNLLGTQEVREMLFQMYAVCLAGDYCDNNKDNNGKAFDAGKVSNVQIVQNSDKSAFNLEFEYDGNKYTKENIPVAEIIDVLFTTNDNLSGFSTINSILIGDKNNVSKNDSEILYENESVRVRRA